jgi:hypothetical protein
LASRVGEYILFLSSPLEQKETVVEMVAAVDVQDDDISNSRTLTTFSVIWALVVEI